MTNKHCRPSTRAKLPWEVLGHKEKIRGVVLSDKDLNILLERHELFLAEGGQELDFNSTQGSNKEARI